MNSAADSSRVSESESASGKNPRDLSPLLLTLAAVFLVAGLWLPFFKVTRVWFFSDQVSVISGLLVLWREGEHVLFLIVAVFTVAFPLAKLGALARLRLSAPPSEFRRQALIRRIDMLGKWSLLDVLVVAVMVVALGSSKAGTISTQPGLWCFALAVLFTHLATRAVLGKSRSATIDTGTANVAGEAVAGRPPSA